MEQIIDKGYKLMTTLKETDSLYIEYENYMMEQTYDVLFFKITQLLLNNDRQLSNALSSIEHLDFGQIGLPESIMDGRERVTLAVAEFETLGSFRTPTEKLDCLLATISVLTGKHDGVFVDSDSLIPLLLETLIQSRVPHLVANLTYIKNYTLERDIVRGQYGFALSTLEGVIDYVLKEKDSLAHLSNANQRLWDAIKKGDLDTFSSLSYVYGARDKQGNTALMMACSHNQPVMSQQLQDQLLQVNDLHMTALMWAVKSNHLEMVKCVLHPKTINAFDRYGNTALLYACMMNDNQILQYLVQHGASFAVQNIVTGDSPLHTACRFSESHELIQYVYDQMKEGHEWKNKRGQSYFHLCRHRAFLETQFLQHRYFILNDVDETGTSAWMNWAKHGRLDLLELVLERGNELQRVDNKGRTVLHMMAYQLTSRGSKVQCGQKSIDEIICCLKDCVGVREWTNGCTALHMATSVLVEEGTAFINALVKYDEYPFATNYINELPADYSKSPILADCIDASYLTLPKKTSSPYRWSVTRSWIQRQDGITDLQFVIKSIKTSGAVNIVTVKRKIQDFLFLRQALLHEIPELFLPTFRHLIDPCSVDLKPPPACLIDEALFQLDYFMRWLQYHPTLQRHDMVLSFVRSSQLQKSVIQDSSFSRRKLQLEKINNNSQPNINGMMNSQEEAYFLNYAHDTISPLRDAYIQVMATGREMINRYQDLEEEMLQVARHAKLVFNNRLEIETLEVCANMTGYRSHVSPWPTLVRQCQMACSVVDGVTLSLQRPLWLVQQRDKLRLSIEHQKEDLRTSKNWTTLFSPKERKKQVEQEKEKIVSTMNELNQTDGQMEQSHLMISDELAYFQSKHPSFMMKEIRKSVKQALIIERHKLQVLDQTLIKWKGVPF
ncbi:ankyrin [Backusella circina FSU 941]|nr:ankyrin [Backusella circina FSU 941]